MLFIFNDFQFLTSDYSSLLLDVNQGNTSDGAKFIQYKYNGFTNQQLKLIPAGDGGYYFIESQKARNTWISLQTML